METITKQEETLHSLEQRIHDLPLLPGVVVKLLSLNSGSDDYFEQVLSLAKADPAFSIQLLRYANSAAISPFHPVTVLDRALMLVGCKGAINMLIGRSAMRVFVPHRNWQLDLWRHAFDVACLMETLAPHVIEVIKLDPAKAYLYGLLHDIGRFMLYLEAPESIRIVDETKWTSPQSLIEAEQRTCGFTHAELGYRAIKKWRLPCEIALAIRYHHTKDLSGTEVMPDDIPIVRLLQDVDWMAMSLALRGDHWRTMHRHELHVMVAPPRIQTFFDLKIDELVDQVRAALEKSEKNQDAMGILGTVEEE